MRVLSLVLLASFTAACGGSGDPATPLPPVVGPAAVTIVTASATFNNRGSFSASEDSITLHLRNSGGAGTFVLEFWTFPNSPGGPRQKAESFPVTFTEGYSETVLYEIPGWGAFQSVKVRTQPVNVSAFTQTDCRVLRNEPSYCP